MQITVRFTKSYGAYNAGVEAGFLPATAKKLIASGYAILVHQETGVQKDTAPTGSGAKGSVRK